MSVSSAFTTPSKCPPVSESATIEAAKLLRIDGTLGSLEPGKLADVVGVRGNPVDDVALLKEVSFVMQDGTVYKQGGDVMVRIGDAVVGSETP